MGRTYEPSSWVVIKSKSDPEVRLVLAGWSGGYLDGDSWGRSSPVVNMLEDSDYYVFETESGAVYKCRKSSEGFNATMREIWRAGSDHFDLERITKETKDD